MTLNISDALESYYFRMERSVAVREAGLKDSKLGWAAYRDLLLRMASQPSDKRSPLLHASSLASTTGWECGRTYFYTLTGEPKESTFPAATYKVFDVGHAVHLLTYQRLMPALEGAYPDTEFHSLEFEKPIPPAADGFIVGTADAVLTFTPPGGTLTRVVIDVKSTSPSQMAKRTQGATIVVEPQYQKQLHVYMAQLEADYGIVLYFEVGWPYPFKQAVVRPNARVIRLMEERTQTALSAIAEGSDVPGTPGLWCQKCDWGSVCPFAPKGAP